MPNNTMSAAMRIMRESSGLTQAQLARSMGVSRSTINRLEAGGRFPTPATLHRWMAACGSDTYGWAISRAENEAKAKKVARSG